jgi:hypothetical protein
MTEANLRIDQYMLLLRYKVLKYILFNFLSRGSRRRWGLF